MRVNHDPALVVDFCRWVTQFEEGVAALPNGNAGLAETAEPGQLCAERAPRVGCYPEKNKFCQVGGMNVFIALIRGINVGGKAILPMQKLIALFAEQGFLNVETYIQSGNVVFESSTSVHGQFAEQISKAISEKTGIDARVVVLTQAELESTLSANPFKEAECDPASLHFGFLASEPVHPDLDKLESMRSKSERYLLKGKVFYLHAPDGVGKSKLAKNTEKLLGVPMTDRNWKTVLKLAEMVKARKQT